MEQFKEKLLKNKVVSVWGAGYLGYTEIMRLQSNGFKVNVFDYTDTGFNEKIKKNEYPGREQVYSWSGKDYVHPIDISKINIAEIDSMFTSNIHIMAFPLADREGNNMLKEIVDFFVNYKGKLENSLIIFLSAWVPGTIDKSFIKILHNSNIKCSIASAFRNDWTIEEFLSDNKKRMLAATDEESLRRIKFFYELLGIKYKILPTIKEAEIYENAKNSFQFITTVFINQLALAYPDTNVRVMTEYLLEDVELNESHLSIGAGGYKMPFSLQNIIDGSVGPAFLTLLRETQNTSLSMILTYAEVIKKIGCKSVTMLGLSIKGNQKNIDLSPAVILAEYLSKLGVGVFVDDPFYDEKSLYEILPSCKVADILKDGLKSEALFVMADHSKYKYITQDNINRLGIYNARIIIDNIPLFIKFKFSSSTIYHAVGDGKMGLI